MRCPNRLSVVAAITICCGCSNAGGPQLAVTSGAVHFHGQPVVGARVVFNPARGRPAQGITDAQGRFQLSTLRPGDGAVVGTHRAVVVAPRSGVEQMSGSAALSTATSAPTIELPERYSKPETSGLEYEVKSDGKNDFALDLE